MNSIIFEQLKKVTATELNFDESSHHIFIPKSLKILSGSLKKDTVYRIKLFDSVINPSKDSTLAANWNNNKVPKHSEYFIEVIDKLGNMIKINGIAVDDQTDNFYGWVPTDSFEVLSKE